mgnify:CR=1 FL=1
MKTVLITQARVGSSRLPGKVLLKIAGATLLDIHLSRVKKAKRVDQVVVATTQEERSDLICDIAEKQGVAWFKGSLEDVLDRFYQTAVSYEADWIVRVTSDCPLLDPAVVDSVIEKAISGDYDYCSNILVEDFPDGQDVEVFKYSALEVAWKQAKKTFEREHVTPFIRNNSDYKGESMFSAADVEAGGNFNKIRMTVDEPADLEMIRWLVNACGIDKNWMTYTDYMLSHPDKLVNKDILRNEGYIKSLKKEL